MGFDRLRVFVCLSVCESFATEIDGTRAGDGSTPANEQHSWSEPGACPCLGDAGQSGGLLPGGNRFSSEWAGLHKTSGTMRTFRRTGRSSRCDLARRNSNGSSAWIFRFGGTPSCRSSGEVECRCRSNSAGDFSQNTNIGFKPTKRGARCVERQVQA